MISPLDRIGEVLERFPGARRCVALSGGVDSMVLFDAVVTLRGTHDADLRVLHVDHGIHPDSAEWAERCIRVCGDAGVPCTVLRVDLPVDPPEGLEAAAREARYGAFAAELGAGELLLTAHHADDQAETVMLALLRGSGPAGLAAMPEMSPLGEGLLVRPMLSVPRAAIVDWAARRGLEWIEDPSNDDRTRARNRLRHEVMPTIRAHWPGAAAAFARSAGLAAEADALLAVLASLDHEALADGPALDADAVSALGSVRARNLLRWWIAGRGLPIPPYERLVEAERQLREAAPDRVPEIVWPGAVLRRWDGRLFVGPPEPELPPDWSADWDGKRPLELPAGAGTIALVAVDGPGLDAARVRGPGLRVGFRHGGERIRLRSGGPHRQVKHLLAGAGIPPWSRDRVPILYKNEAPVAVGDLFSDADWHAPQGAAAIAVRWGNRLS